MRHKTRISLTVCILLYSLITFPNSIFAAPPSQPETLPILPEQYPEIQNLLFSSTICAKRGKISESFKDIYRTGEIACPNQRDSNSYKNAEILSPFFLEIVVMPFRVSVSNGSFDLDKIDSSDKWQRFHFPDSLTQVLLDRPIVSMDTGPAGQIILRDDGENLVFFDGTNWTVYQFAIRVSRCFAKTAIATSPTRGVFFGTENAPFSGRDDGQQGICSLSADGVINRVFWPPLLEGWLHRKDLGICHPTQDQIYWDITALHFSTPDILWAGMLGGVIRLDFKNDQWDLFDRTNSPIDGTVVHIANTEDPEMIRVITRQHWLDEFNTGNTNRKGQIFTIDGDQIIEEKIEPEAAEAINDWYGGRVYDIQITSSRDGTLWFTGSGALWAFSHHRAKRIIPLPVPRCSRLFVDSSGQIWIGEGNCVWILQNTQWQCISDQFIHEMEAKHITITEIGEDPAGRIWTCWDRWSNETGDSQRVVYLLSEAGRRFHK